MLCARKAFWQGFLVTISKKLLDGQPRGAVCEKMQNCRTKLQPPFPTTLTSLAPACSWIERREQRGRPQHPEDMLPRRPTQLQYGSSAIPTQGSSIGHSDWQPFSPRAVGAQHGIIGARYARGNHASFDLRPKSDEVYNKSKKERAAIF